MALATLSTLALFRGQYERAAALLLVSIAAGQMVERTSQRSLGVIRSLVWLGRVESKRDAAETAISVCKDVLAQMRHSGVTGYEPTTTNEHAASRGVQLR